MVGGFLWSLRRTVVGTYFAASKVARGASRVGEPRSGKKSESGFEVSKFPMADNDNDDMDMDMGFVPSPFSLSSSHT